MVLDIPKYMKNLTNPVLESPYNADKIQFTCYGSPVPSINVPPIDIAFGGQVFKVSSNSRPSYPPLNLSFVVDNGWKNYYLLFKWIDLFNGQQDGSIKYNFSNRQEPDNLPNRNHLSIADMVTTFKTYALDEFNNKIVEFSYSEVFPTSLGEINFSHQEPSEITCKASFTFNQLSANLIKDVDKNSCVL
jgi:hypothetical protein